MKKKVIVKQKHRYTQQSTVLYQGVSDYQTKDNHTRISYIEDGSACKVMLDASNKKMNLERIGNGIHTRLSFINGTNTKGSVTSTYGTITLEVHTYKYIKTEDVIAVEYDILISGEVSDGYLIIWNLREGLHESD